MWGKQSQSKPPEVASPPPAPPPTRPQETRAEAPAAAAPAGRPSGEATPTTRITAGITIHGDVTGRENLYLDGEVRGSVSITGANVTVGPNGRVEADVEAREIEVHGRLRGTLEARERVRIGASGSVHGEIIAQRLAIEEGAVFCGSVEMARPGEARPARAAEPRTAAAAAGAGATSEAAAAPGGVEGETGAGAELETEKAVS